MVQLPSTMEPLAAAGGPYGLPPLPQLPCPEFRGPTPWSNWVIRGRLLAGAYPASLDDAETDRILTTLLELGVNTFVCLQAEFSLHTPESAWRSGQGLRPYIKDAQKILIRSRETNSQTIKQDKLDFLHLPIIDGSVTSDVALSRLADDCCMRILRGERMYIHCWGGHGRTGTLVAVMLARLYDITCAAALRFTQAFHDSRKFPQGVRSPQTQPQVAQVKRLLPDPPSVRGIVYTKDPSIVLDDKILRPSSAPRSPVAKAPASPAAPSPVVIAAAVADMEVDEQRDLPSVPVNQQRKEAIRAKTGSSAVPAPAPASGPASAPAVPATAAGITAALQAASLQPKQSPPPMASAAAAPADTSAQQGYLRQYIQQQERMADYGPATAKGLPGGSSPNTIFLKATSGIAAGLDGLPTKLSGEDAQQTVDITAALRPSRVTVAVPAMDAAERSGSSIARIMNYFSGRTTPTPR